MENEPRHCAIFGGNKATALTKGEAETYEPRVIMDRRSPGGPSDDS